MAEAGGRCAVPTCKATNPLEIAHIKTVKDKGGDDFYNLIILCKNCHHRFDDPKEKSMSREQLINIKKNLIVLNGRYCAFEIRVLDYFKSPSNETIQLFGREIDVMYLLKDGLIEDTGIKMMNAIDLPPKEYRLTYSGREFIERWQQAILLENQVL